jgi:hypothetical protein
VISVHKSSEGIGGLFKRLRLRKRFVFTLTLALIVLAPARADDDWGRRRIAVDANPLDAFEIGAPSRTRFGQLDYVGGLVLRAEIPRFGGFSSLAFDPASGQLMSITDHGWWLRGKLLIKEGKPTGLTDAEMAPVLGPDGKPVGRTKRFDTESLTLHDGIAFVGIERTHEVLRFDLGRDGLAARGQTISVPAEVKKLPSNQSLEAVCYAAHGPARGTLIAIAERARKGENLPTRGFILMGAHKGAFDLIRHDDFDITDCAFAPNGDLFVLERRFGWFSGLAIRLRKIDPRTIKPDATLDGVVLMEAGPGMVIDNMEGLAISKNEKGETMLTLISDDNFSMLQRTVLLQFRLREE